MADRGPTHKQKEPSPSWQACCMAADVEQRETVVFVMHPGVHQTKPQNL